MQKRLFSIVTAVSHIVIPVGEGKGARPWRTQHTFVTNLATIVGYLVLRKGRVPSRKKQLTDEETDAIVGILSDLELASKPKVSGVMGVARSDVKYDYGAPNNYVRQSPGVGPFLQNQAQKYRNGVYTVATKQVTGLFKPYHEALVLCNLLKTSTA